MTQSSGTQTQQQQSQSSPWAPTQPGLQNIINSLGGLGTNVTPQQYIAGSNLSNAASAIPNYGPTVGNVANTYLNGGANNGVANAATAATNTLSPYLNSGYLNPMNTPGLGNNLNYVQQQIANQVNGQFAGAGRDLSPANSQALGYGEMGALAPILTSQYNQNVGAQQNAAQNIFNIANAANQAYLQNAGFGVNTAGAIPNLFTAPATAQVGAAQQAYGLPFGNIGAGEGLLLPIAGLGGQQQGSGQTNTSYTPSPFSVATSIFGGGANSPFSGASGALSGGLGFLGML